jgi:lysophospholipase L1-like esterase
MDISNKKVYFLGDSITEGAGASRAENSFVGRFKTAYPNAEIINYGRGGTRIAKQLSPSENGGFDYHFIARANDMQPDADLIVVFGGTNDFGHGNAPLGDIHSKDEKTFYGALYTLFENLLLKYPLAKILVLTPLRRGDEVNNRGMTLQEYVTAVKERAAYFALPVLDLYTTSGMNPQVANVQQTLMPDGLHPNDEGHNRLFQLINAYICNMM